MSHGRKVAAIAGAVVATSAVVLATRPASPAGPWDGWGCPPAQIGTSTYTFIEGEGGFASADQALRAEAEFQATDGALEGDRYLEALGSGPGPTLYDPGTGELHLDGKVYARSVASQRADGTWVVEQITNCGPPPPAGTSPGPTPG